MTDYVASAYYSLKRKLFTILHASLSATIIYIILRSGQASLAGWFGVAIILGVPLVFTAFEFWCVRIDVTSTALHCQSPWSGDRVVPLSDVKSVNFSYWWQCFQIHTKNNGIVRLNGNLRGVYDVLNLLESLGHRYPRVRHINF